MHDCNIPTRIWAAGLSRWIDFRMVAPSLVTLMSPWSWAEMRILSMPLGPNVFFTKSPTAMAPTKMLYNRPSAPRSGAYYGPTIGGGLTSRACSARSSVALFANICTGARDYTDDKQEMMNEWQKGQTPRPPTMSFQSSKNLEPWLSHLKKTCWLRPRPPQGRCCPSLAFPRGLTLTLMLCLLLYM